MDRFLMAKHNQIIEIYLCSDLIYPAGNSLGMQEMMEYL